MNDSAQNSERLAVGLADFARRLDKTEDLG